MAFGFNRTFYRTSLKNLRKRGKISEAMSEAAKRDLRLALLKPALLYCKGLYQEKVRERAVGHEVI